MREGLRGLFRETRAGLGGRQGGPLEQLTVAGVDAEQIWAQLQLLNGPSGRMLETSVARALRTSVVLTSEVEESGEEEMSEEPEEEHEQQEPERENVVDFFSAADMERFVKEAEDLHAAGDNEEMEDDDSLAGGEEEDLEAGAIGYHDFFTAIDGGDSGKGDGEFDFVQHNREEPMQPKGKDSALKSVFEKRAEAIALQVERLEGELVGEKHWAFKGEVSKRDRPESSLLDAFVDFDQVTQGVPLLPEDHTARIEAIIKRRALEGTFDDVAKRTEEDRLAWRSKPKVELQFSRSEKGLGQVFEDAFQEAATGRLEEGAPPEHVEAQHLFRSLCQALDQLTNDHYRPSAPEVKVVAPERFVLGSRVLLRNCRSLQRTLRPLHWRRWPPLEFLERRCWRRKSSVGGRGTKRARLRWSMATASGTAGCAKRRPRRPSWRRRLRRRRALPWTRRLPPSWPRQRRWRRLARSREHGLGRPEAGVAPKPARSLPRARPFSRTCRTSKQEKSDYTYIDSRVNQIAGSTLVS